MTPTASSKVGSGGKAESPGGEGRVKRDMLLITAEDPPLHKIIAEVAKKYALTYVDLISRRRTRKLVWPRQEAMWRCLKETTASYPEIGRAIGGRDHTTVIHGVRAHEARMGGTEWRASGQ